MKIMRTILFAVIFFGGLLLLAPRAYAGHVARNITCPTTGGGQNCAEQQPTGQTWYYCGATCQSLPSDLGSSYTLNCGTSVSPNTCAWQCQSPHVVCGGVCGNSQATGNGTQNFNDGDTDLTDGKLNDCGTIVCRTDYVMCGSDCKAPATTSCPTGTTLNQCTGACDSPYVLISPAVAQSGFFNVTGSSRIGTDFTVGMDLYLNDGRAVRVDKKGSSTLMIGNYRTDPSGPLNNGTDFHLTLHAAANAVADLILQQGTNDRWALSVRPGTSNFAIWRNQAGPGWDAEPLFAIDYATGHVSIANNLSVGGSLTVGGAVVLTQPAQCGNGQVLQWNGTTWICATPSTAPTYTAGDYLTIGADNKISATHNGGCFGPVFDHVTADSYDGNRVGGYSAANQLCSAGQHVCTGTELLNSINCGIVLPATGTAWASVGLPGFTSPAVNDCTGWQTNSGTKYGAYWDFSARAGFSTSCDQPLQFACCR